MNVTSQIPLTRHIFSAQTIWLVCEAILLHIPSLVFLLHPHHHLAQATLLLPPLPCLQSSLLISLMSFFFLSSYFLFLFHSLLHFFWPVFFSPLISSLFTFILPSLEQVRLIQESLDAFREALSKQQKQQWQCLSSLWSKQLDLVTVKIIMDNNNTMPNPQTALRVRRIYIRAARLQEQNAFKCKIRHSDGNFFVGSNHCWQKKS